MRSRRTRAFGGGVGRTVGSPRTKRRSGAQSHATAGRGWRHNKLCDLINLGDLCAKSPNPNHRPAHAREPKPRADYKSPVLVAAPLVETMAYFRRLSLHVCAPGFASLAARMAGSKSGHDDVGWVKVNDDWCFVTNFHRCLLTVLFPRFRMRLLTAQRGRTELGRERRVGHSA
jgi:hypothetical protein